jgi:hypothetical protein
MKDIGGMTEKEFMELPRAEWEETVECYSLIIIPGKGTKKALHDSGYRTMTFIAVNEEGVPFKRLSGCSDVIHFDGIGGYGYHWVDKYQTVPKMVPPSGWSMDCLPKTGFMRIMSKWGMICNGMALSSFEIYMKEEKSEK